MIHDQNLKAHVFALIQRKEKGEKKHVKLNYDMGYQNISRSFFSELKKKEFRTKYTKRNYNYNSKLMLAQR